MGNEVLRNSTVSSQNTNGPHCTKPNSFTQQHAEAIMAVVQPTEMMFFLCVCVCVCVCAGESEGERKREGEIMYI